MRCRNFLASFSLLVMSVFVFAQEEVVEKFEDKNYSGKQSQDWEKTQAQLGTVKGKLESQVGLIRSLIAEKSLLKGGAVTLKMEELKKEHIRLQALTDEYNKLNLEYLTKFPERGLKEKRLYKRIKAKSLQSFEEDQTVQGRVNRLHNKILNQYPKSNTEIKKKKTKSLSQPKNSPESEGISDDKDITHQIILKK